MKMSNVELLLHNLFSSLGTELYYKAPKEEIFANGKGRLVHPLRVLYKDVFLDKYVKGAIEDAASWVSKSFNGQIDYTSLDAVQYMIYGFLLTNLVYGVDMDTGKRNIYSLSHEAVEYALFMNVLYGVDRGLDEKRKNEKALDDLEYYNVCAKVKEPKYDTWLKKKINSTVELAKTEKIYKIYAYRVDKSHGGINRGFTITKPRECLDMNKTLFILMGMYNCISHRYIEFLKSGNIVYIKDLKGRSGLFTLNRDLLNGVYGAEEAELRIKKFENSVAVPYSKWEKIKEVDTYSSMLVPSLTVSPLAKSGISIDTIAVSGVLNKESVIKFLSQGYIKMGSDVLKIAK